MENKGNQGFVPQKPVEDVGQALDGDKDADDMLDDFLAELGDDFDLSNMPVPGGGPKPAGAAAAEAEDDEESDENPSGHYLGIQGIEMRENEEGIQ